MSKKTTRKTDGVTEHCCAECGAWFEGTGKRGRPFRKCPECRAAKVAYPAGKDEV